MALAHQKGIDAAMTYLHEHPGYTRVHNPLTGKRQKPPDPVSTKRVKPRSTRNSSGRTHLCLRRQSIQRRGRVGYCSASLPTRRSTTTCRD
jgi:hypothetical protein